MIYTIPHYYKKFKCIASQCPDTCCAGWAIMIDKRSLEQYRQIGGPLGNRLHNSIDWKESCFKQYDRRCAFLNEENLCDLYTEAGPDQLCRTCRTYPRHIEEFEGCREISLCMSCIEAAKLILGCREPVRFITKEDEREESYKDFDFFLYTKLMDARDLILAVMQDRALDTGKRKAVCLALAHDLQGRIRRERLFEADGLLTRYRKADRDSRFAKRLQACHISPEERYDIMKEMFGVFGKMEVLNQDWPEFAGRAEGTLYGAARETNGARQTYGDRRDAFLNSRAGVMLPLWREQIMVYFIFTYFCGAVYDGNPYGKMKMAVGSALLIEELAQAVWENQGRRLEFEDFVDVAHRFSREVEHSDENRRCLEAWLLNRPAFRLKRILGAVEV